MKDVEQLILAVRRSTENEKLGDTDGISDEEFIQYLNDAQEDIADALMTVDTDILTKEYIFSAVNGQEVYDLPDDLYSNSHIVSLEFTTGAPSFYQEITPVTLKERDSIPGYPRSYMIMAKTSAYSPSLFTWVTSGGLVITPVPNITGTFRLMYKPRIPTLDIIRGRTDVPSHSGSGYLSGVTLREKSLTRDNKDNSNNNYSEKTWVTIWDKENKIQMNKALRMNESDMPFIATSLSFNFETGDAESNTTAGMFILFGKDAVNVSILPDLCEKYLRVYTEWKIFRRDSSEDAKETLQELAATRKGILEALATKSSDVVNIPITDSEWF